MTMHAIVNRRLNDELAQILEDYPDLPLSDLLIGIEAAKTDAPEIFHSTQLEAAE